MTRQPTTTRRHSRTWLGALGALLATGAFTVTSGGPGLLVGATVAVGWYALPSVYAFAVGQFALAALTPESPVVLGLGEAGLVAVLVESVADRERPLRGLAAAAVGVGAAAAATWTVVGRAEPLWKPVALLAVGFAVLAYGLHRYERLALGLVEEAT